MDEDAHKVKITYETLYEILRREKGREELQKLDETFIFDSLEYLKEKSKILDEAMQKHDIFSMDEKENTQMQLKNIKKIIKELYERREKKIIEMAMNKSRTRSNIINTENLLAHEYDFFNMIIKILDGFRQDVLLSILTLQEPKINMECLTKEEKQIDKTQAELDKKEDEIIKPLDMPSEQETKSELSEPKPIATPESEQKSTLIKKKIKFVQKVEQFVGKELELYGPYDPEQTAELPIEIADVLINKGDALSVE